MRPATTLQIEHLAFYVDAREEVDAAYQRCLETGTFPPEDDRDLENFLRALRIRPRRHPR
jgi:hypothetical protein